MGFRSLVLFSIFAAAVSVAPSARADVPNPTTGSGGSTSSATTGAGGAASKYDPECSVDTEQVAGSTCQECDPTKGCSVPKDYNLVCQRSATAAVYCNGPNRNQFSDSNVACSVALPGGSWSGAVAGGALAAAIAGLLRRRRRG